MLEPRFKTSACSHQKSRELIFPFTTLEQLQKLQENVFPRKSSLWAERWGTESTAVPGSDFTYRDSVGHLLHAVTSHSPNPEDFQQLCAQPVAKRARTPAFARAVAYVPCMFPCSLKHEWNTLLLWDYYSWKYLRGVTILEHLKVTCA